MDDTKALAARVRWLESVLEQERAVRRDIQGSRDHYESLLRLVLEHVSFDHHKPLSECTIDTCGSGALRQWFGAEGIIMEAEDSE